MTRALFIAALAVVACDAGDAGDESGDSETGVDTEAMLAPCDAQPTITYDTFGRGFLATYCDGCHGTDVTNRQGAPDDVVFDDRETAETWADRILVRSAPEDGSAPTMPPAGGVPDDDRDRLLVWLTCGE